MKNKLITGLGILLVFLVLSCQKIECDCCNMPNNPLSENAKIIFKSLPVTPFVYSSYSNPNPPDFNGYQFSTTNLNSNNLYGTATVMYNSTKTLFCTSNCFVLSGQGTNDVLFLVESQYSGDGTSYLFYKGTNITAIARPAGYAKINEVRVDSNLLYIKYWDSPAMWSHDSAFYSRFNLSNLELESTVFK